MRKNPGFIITLLAGMLSVTGLQAQNSGFYAVGGANLKYNDKELLFLKDAYKVLDVTLNRLSAALVYYF